MKKSNFISAAVIAGLLLCASCLLWHCCYGNREKAPADTEYRQLHNILLEHRTEYLNTNRCLLYDFRTQLPGKIRQEFAAVDGAVDEVAAEVSSLGFCTALCWDMLKSAAGESRAVNARFQEVYSARLLPGLAAAEAALQEEFRNFQHLLRENDNRFRAGITGLREPENRKVKISYRHLTEGLQQLGSESSGFALNKTLTCGGAALELLFIRSSAAAVRRLYQHIILRWSKQLSAGALCAAADGPLPVGDMAGAVIGVGGTVWTSWDLWQIAYRLPEEMKTLLREIIAGHRKELYREYLLQAEMMISLREKESGVIIEKFLAGEKRHDRN